MSMQYIVVAHVRIQLLVHISINLLCFIILKKECRFPLQISSPIDMIDLAEVQKLQGMKIFVDILDPLGVCASYVDKGWLRQLVSQLGIFIRYLLVFMLLFYSIYLNLHSVLIFSSS